MSIQPTVIHIIQASSLSLETLATCDSRATAVYYLAFTAAYHGLPFETVVDDEVYRIGHVRYFLHERTLITTDDVGGLRRALEGHLVESKTGVEGLPLLRLLGVCSGFPLAGLPVTPPII